MITAREATMWDTEGCAYGYTSTSCQAYKQIKRVENTNFMSNLLQNANFNIECDCTKLWTDEVFEDVLADSHRTIETRATHGCLKHILSCRIAKCSP